MSEYINFISLAFVTLFIIVDPIGNVPLFLSITKNNTDEERDRIIKKASISTVFILVLFLFTGNLILNLFHITIGAFKIAGGILLFIIAIRMLFAFHPTQKTTPKEEAEAIDKEDVSVFPLAIPLLSGPGAITTVILIKDLCKDVVHYFIALSSILAIAILTYITLKQSQRLMRYFGQTGISIMIRLMGLLLSVIAVQFVINGMAEVLPKIMYLK
jgi:multiple antibiotic resistance protein